MVLSLGLLSISFLTGYHEKAAEVYLESELVLRKVPVYNVDTTEKVVALTFDAAWGADKTEEILNILKQYEIRATFFLVGFWVEDYPEQAKKIVEAGMEIGTHSNTHPDMVKISAQAQEEELQTSKEIIQKQLNYECKLFRAPFGSYNNTLMSIAEKLGLTTIQWDVDTLDWKGISAKEITNRVMAKAKNGSIILFHNNSDHVLSALPIVIEGLKNKGYQFKSVGEMIYTENAYVDMNGIQHQKKNRILAE